MMGTVIMGISVVDFKSQKLWKNDGDGLQGLFSLGYNHSQKDRTSFICHCVLWEFYCSIRLGGVSKTSLWFEVETNGAGKGLNF